MKILYSNHTLQSSIILSKVQTRFMGQLPTTNRFMGQLPTTNCEACVVYVPCTFQRTRLRLPGLSPHDWVEQSVKNNTPSVSY